MTHNINKPKKAPTRRVSTALARLSRLHAWVPYAWSSSVSVVRLSSRDPCFGRSRRHDKDDLTWPLTTGPAVAMASPNSRATTNKSRRSDSF